MASWDLPPDVENHRIGIAVYAIWRWRKTGLWPALPMGRSLIKSNRRMMPGTKPWIKLWSEKLLSSANFTSELSLQEQGTYFMCLLLLRTDGEFSGTLSYPNGEPYTAKNFMPYVNADERTVSKHLEKLIKIGMLYTDEGSRLVVRKFVELQGSRQELVEIPLNNEDSTDGQRTANGRPTRSLHDGSRQGQDLRHPIEESKRKSKKKNKHHVELRSTARSVFEYYLLKTERTEKQYKLTELREKKIISRLEEGFSEIDLKKAVDRMVSDPWEERHRFIEVELHLFKNRETVEKWINSDGRSGGTSKAERELARLEQEGRAGGRAH